MQFTGASFQNQFSLLFEVVVTDIPLMRTETLSEYLADIVAIGMVNTGPRLARGIFLAEADSMDKSSFLFLTRHLSIEYV